MRNQVDGDSVGEPNYIQKVRGQYEKFICYCLFIGRHSEYD